MPVALGDEELAFLRTKLKSGEYDGTDIMYAWLVIDELRELRAWRDKAFQAHPNLDLDIETMTKDATPRKVGSSELLGPMLNEAKERR